jgi:hypothetical protein
MPEHIMHIPYLYRWWYVPVPSSILLCFMHPIIISPLTRLIKISNQQTGNTIFVALGISNLPVDTPNYAWTKSITSILAFIVGTLLFSTFHRTFGARKRWPLILTFVIQAILVFISASLIAGRSSSESPAKPPTVANRILPSDPGFPWADLIPIALLSLQASAKILSSRWLESPHLTTCVLTVLYSDLFADPALFSAGLMGNGKRNQRVSGAVVYFVGAALGGALAKSSVGFEGALWISGACNLGIAGAWAMWWREEGKGDEED